MVNTDKTKVAKQEAHAAISELAYTTRRRLSVRQIKRGCTHRGRTFGGYDVNADVCQIAWFGQSLFSEDVEDMLGCVYET